MHHFISPLCGEHDVKLVDPLEVLRLAEQHQVGVPAGSDKREGPQQVAVGEVFTGCDELPLVRRAAVVLEPAPSRIDLQKRVLDEMANGHYRSDSNGCRPGTLKMMIRGPRRCAERLMGRAGVALSGSKPNLGPV